MTAFSRATFTGLTALCLALAIPSAAHASRMLDPFTASLPDLTLPYSTTPAPILWAGALGAFTLPTTAAHQTGLASVVGGGRVTRVAEPTISNFVYALLDAGQLSFASASGPSGLVTLEYGASANMNLNLWGDGSRSFELQLDGDLNDGGAPRPVQLTITVRNGATTVHRTFTLLNDGVYRFPFSAFTGVSFTDVDYLKFQFDATAVTGVDYTLLGGLRTSNTP